MCNNETNECSCIAEILKVISILQKNAICPESCLDTCDRGFLGNPISSIGYNTRPVMLYTGCGNGTPWRVPTTRDDVSCDDEGATCSTVFRIEKIDGCCATFRVLADNPDTTQVDTIPYVTTDSFFTMDLNCVCSIRCLNDTYVDLT